MINTTAPFWLLAISALFTGAGQGEIELFDNVGPPAVRAYFFIFFIKPPEVRCKTC